MNLDQLVALPFQRKEGEVGCEALSCSIRGHLQVNKMATEAHPSEGQWPHKTAAGDQSTGHFRPLRRPVPLKCHWK